jgi:hypothetical protein
MEWLLGFLGIVVLVALAVLWLRWKGAGLVHSSHIPLTHSSHAPNAAGYSVWCYEGQSWTLKEDKSAPGYVVGHAPVDPGEFEGQCVKVPSTRDPGAS